MEEKKHYLCKANEKVCMTQTIPHTLLPTKNCLTIPFLFVMNIATFRIFAVLLTIVFSVPCLAHPMYKVDNYDAYTKNLLDIRHIGQDKKGFIWISTGDGLYRFDGYRFTSFKPQHYSTTTITNDAIEYMASDENGNLWCKIENRIFFFDTDNYTFHNALERVEKEKTYTVKLFRCLPDGTTCVVCDKGTVFLISNNNPLSSARQIYHAGEDIISVNHNNVTQDIWMTTKRFTAVIRKGQITLTDKKYEAPETNAILHTDRFGKEWRREEITAPGILRTYVVFADNQDNVWYVYERHLYRISFYLKNYDKIETEDTSMRCAKRDSKGRMWITRRYSNLITIYNPDNSFAGYFTSDGVISKEKKSFSSRVHDILEDSRGNIWFCTKPDGLIRLRRVTYEKYTIEHYNTQNSTLSDNEMIKICEDKQGRLWACGFRNGINMITIDKNGDPLITPVLPETQKRAVLGDMKFRDITLTKEGALLASTSKGLIIYDIRKNIKELQQNIGVTHHLHDKSRPNSINSSAIKTAIQSEDGNIYVCTMDAGIDKVTSASIFHKVLTFQHFCTENGFPSDYVRAITETDKTMWVTTVNSLIEWNPSLPLPESAKIRIILDTNDFSESTPVERADGTWLYGVMDGCITVDISKLTDKNTKREEKFPIVVTSAIDRDTLVLEQDERTLTLSFATLDYDNPQHINYAVRFSAEEEGKWQYLGETHNISFQHLKPGEYTLYLRSTDGTGKWLSNERKIIVKVIPHLYETWWWKVLQSLFILFLIAIGLWVWKYIKNMEKQQRETLDAYMQLMDHQKEQLLEEQERYRMALLEKAKIEPHNDQFIKLVMEYIEKNISSSDIDIDAMAQYAAVSRSHLNHKLKHVLGVTPSEMIREARIKHACLLLKDYNMSINDIAYSCGFTDPKYFSKCFKASTGYTPTNYRLRL